MGGISPIPSARLPQPRSSARGRGKAGLEGAACFLSSNTGRNANTGRWRKTNPRPRRAPGLFPPSTQTKASSAHLSSSLLRPETPDSATYPLPKPKAERAPPAAVAIHTVSGLTASRANPARGLGNADQSRLLLSRQGPIYEERKKEIGWKSPALCGLGGFADVCPHAFPGPSPLPSASATPPIRSDA